MLIEFGLRRAQGPDGALSASKYAFVGGFDASSNVLAGKLTGISIKGTLAHSLVMTYSGLHELTTQTLVPKAGGDPVDIVELILNKYMPLFDFPSKPNMGELAAFIMFAQAFPDNFLALIDTYDTLKSGVCNFLLVGAALSELGYRPVGVRLDSGDLRYLSVEVRRAFVEADARMQAQEAIFAKCTIVASNDINEEVRFLL
jgi:nicotinate phosphoribosyltransferase